MLKSDVEKKLSIVVPKAQGLQDLLTAPDLPPFHSDIIEFIGAYSRAIMKSSQARAYPEIISLAHWMRRRAILDLKENFEATRPENTVSVSRGVVLHFAPGNVDTIFLYSALLAIVTGNRNIVRISSRPSPQIDILTDVLNSLLDDPIYDLIASRLLIVKYDHDDEVTRELSKFADLRVIWGGDDTVDRIRAFPLRPHARDISFPNRWSLAVLSANSILDCDNEELEALGMNFANDAYWFGQMACSSPRLAVWIGAETDTAAAAKRFWPMVRKAADRFTDEIPAVGYVNKLVSLHVAAIEGKIVGVTPSPDNTVSVAEMRAMEAPDDSLFVGDGQFLEVRSGELSEICSLLNRQSQTVVSFGIDASDWRNLVAETGTQIDRIVPFGQALQFGHIWDGMDLLSEFSRLVSIKV